MTPLNRQQVDPIRRDEPRYWRGIDELRETPESLDYLHREFPQHAGELRDSASRRTFLKLMAASLGLAGVSLSGCLRQPEEKFVLYVRQPEDLVPVRGRGARQYESRRQTRLRGIRRYDLSLRQSRCRCVV